ncbi:MAG: 23S rRNA (uracil(1939)-C(5))-methyltransferase RlmD [Erysipelotrichaceae bacterium]|nr:23S rRNA (uracil(1939)-C(5))-methyltransferase RlmD [Erysipelotrichaceae bacterium]
MKVDDRFILDIKRLGINGEGIGFYNKLAIFVDGAIPGEGHEVMITKCENKMAFAKSLNIKRISSERKEAECPYYEACGGCAVMHINYENMLKHKRNLLIEALNRYTRLDARSFEIRATVQSPEHFGYRNKSQLPIKKFDTTKVCMIKARTNDLIPVDNCLVNKSLINRLNEEILKIADELGISSYLYKFSRGILKYLVIRVNKNDEALVCFVCHEKSKKIQELAKRVIELDGVKSVYENFNDSKKQGVIFGKETNHLEGDKYIVEMLGDIKYQIYPTTFFQLNTIQAEAMYSTVLKACKLSKKERVLDAYCGVGAIGLYVARMAKEVIGIEYNKESILAANENAKLNKINNAKFYQGDAAQLLPKMINDGKEFDIVICDPPRTGLGAEFINTILKTQVKRVIYVSCNPATLAKDLEILREKYNVKSITPFDMFPQTPLVESVTVLDLKKDL